MNFFKIFLKKIFHRFQVTVQLLITNVGYMFSRLSCPSRGWQHVAPEVDLRESYHEILLAMGYKSFEPHSVLMLLAHCPHVSPISRYGTLHLPPQCE